MKPSLRALLDRAPPPKGSRATRRVPCDFTVPAGTRLFHGTLDTDFDPRRIGPGGDDVTWFAETPDVAQTYIPCAGLTSYTNANELVRPSESDTTQALQRLVGIDYDLSQVTWGPTGRAQSFRLPRGWSELPEPADLYPRLRALGIHVRTPFDSIRVGFSRGEPLLPPGTCATGRLLVYQVRRALRLWDLDKARPNADLLSPTYREIGLFREAERSGCDGVRIADYAQSDHRGNVGHLSIGLFRKGLTRIRFEVAVPAQHYGWPDGYKNGGMTPEWTAWLARHTAS